MYSMILKQAIGDSVDLCVSIDCRDIVYPFCFIRSETDKYLVVDSTRDDGTEGIVVIPKNNILSVSVVYQQDMDKIFVEEEKKDEMFG